VDTPLPSPEERRRERDRLMVLWMDLAVASPGGWTAPEGRRAGWNWTPPHGVRLHLDRMPRWVRLLHATPFVDRFAKAYMWDHGGYDVLPPGVE